MLKHELAVIFAVVVLVAGLAFSLWVSVVAILIVAGVESPEWIAGVAVGIAFGNAARVLYRRTE